ncbi:MAG: hypothetical protein ACYTF7_02575 [Planctomycetota bacterium]|jgi:hypothetical protein
MYESHPDIKPFPLRALAFLGLAGWGMIWYGGKHKPANSGDGFDLLLDVLFNISGKPVETVLHEFSTTMTSYHWLEVVGFCSMVFCVLTLILWMLGASQAAASAQPRQPKRKNLVNEN